MGAILDRRTTRSGRDSKCLQRSSRNHDDRNGRDHAAGSEIAGEPRFIWSQRIHVDALSPKAADEREPRILLAARAIASQETSRSWMSARV